ncbi:hypothetical protein Vafri_214 [Volvox africanus]|nr:hypothetical protein Vafri_214 [Volvox africanus]
MEFIVEPSLRQHFAIPHPSPDYESVLSRTPDVFVGGSCRLVSIIQLLCALMADSFQREGLPLPPWRREAAMLSKWLPHPARIRDLTPRRSETQIAQSQLPSVALATVSMQALQIGRPDIAVNSPNPLFSPISGVATSLPSPIQALDGEGSRCLPALPWTVTPPGFIADRPCPALGRCPQANVVVGFEVGTAGSLAVCQRRDAAAPKARDGLDLGRNQGHSLRDSAISNGPETDARSYSSVGEALDECASPCVGPLACDDTSSFLFASETSDGNSPLHVYDTPSPVGSPVSDAVAPTGTLFLRGHRPACTGMLPCPSLGVGLLSAKLLLEPLAVMTEAMAAPPSTGATGTVHGRGA